MTATEERRHIWNYLKQQEGVSRMVQTQSVKDFCKAYGISRSLFYKLQRHGLGPKVMKVGRRTLITNEASNEWRNNMQINSAKYNLGVRHA